jgi:putative membrane protein
MQASFAEGLRAAAAFLVPWEFSPLAFVLCVGGLAAYVTGLRRTPAAERPSIWRRIAFFAGVILVWVVMQTRFDYLAQHMFFMHRIQHLVLHHLGAFLIALSNPVAVLASGLPRALRERAAPLWHGAAMQRAVRMVQNVWVAPVIFVGLVFLWLTPAVHFVAMLSPDWYWVMNWSMFLDGILFWALVLDPRTPAQGAWAGLGARIWMVILAMPPQIVLGAYIALSGTELFDVYGLCGRAWDMSAATDQTIGGLVTWIQAADMHVIAALILIGRWMRADRGRQVARAAALTAGAGG